MSVCCLLSGTDFSKQNRHIPKKDDEWSVDSHCALEIILICQKCQHLLLCEGNQNTSGFNPVTAKSSG